MTIAMSDRTSWHTLHARWQAADSRIKGQPNYPARRARIMPPKLDARLDNMLRRIVSNGRLVANLRRHQAPDWMPPSLQRAQWQVKDSVGALLRHVRRSPDHPRGGLNGIVGEFTPVIREFLSGRMSDADFLIGIGWQLRLLDDEVNMDEEKRAWLNESLT